MLLFRQAEDRDAAICARILAAGFARPLEKLFGSGDSSPMIADFLRLYRKRENRGFIVAAVDEETIGFILITKNLKRLLFRLIVPGILSIAWKVFTRKYHGLAVRPLLAAAFGSFNYYGKSFAVEEKTGAAAQLVIMAVDKRFQGRGIGKQLLWKGYDYLKSCGVSLLKLEVRQDNAPAMHIYQKEGFVETGRVASAVGTSIVMVKTL